MEGPGVSYLGQYMPKPEWTMYTLEHDALYCIDSLLLDDAKGGNHKHNLSVWVQTEVISTC